ncbi:MAG: hypothetical protein LCH82_02120 [Actinobacteria bacterium]|nr:hypothetical protein [Actinomycetota bacterium]
MTVAGETVLVARNPSSEGILEAREASNPAVRWMHRICTYPIHGYTGGRAESGPVVVDSGGRKLALIKDFSLCDDHGNCSRNWQRVGITALDVSTGEVAWSTMDSDAPEVIPATPNRWSNVRLLGVTEGGRCPGRHPDHV